MPSRPNTPDPNNPNRQCTCGWRRFRNRVVRTTETVDRYVYFDNADLGGYGSLPLGLPYGSGGLGEWGLFSGDLRTTSTQTVCENCARIRLEQVISSVVVYGAFITGDYIYIVVSDTEASGTGCLELRFDGDGPVTALALNRSYPVLPLPAETPSGDTYETPPGTAASMLRAPIPVAAIEGVYEVFFVDRCSGFEESLGTVILESDMIVLNPKDAHINGAPDYWLTHNVRSRAETIQIASGAVLGIPFDKCDAVIEYDARFGTNPTSQGFTLTGTPSVEALVSGGALQLTTPGAAAATYYTQDVTLAATVDRVNMYVRYNHRANVDADAAGAGFNVVGAYANGSATPYNGARLKHYDVPDMVLLDGSADTAFTIDPTAYKNLNGWREMAAQHHGTDAISLVSKGGEPEQVANTVFGSIAGPAGADPVLRAQFGDIEGTGVDTLIQNVVVSAPGRFMRASFRAFATTAAPTLRLHLVSDLRVGAFTTARFLVRYGALGVGGDPTAFPTDTVAGTVDFVTANQMFELSLALTALPSGVPFWFTVERDHTHADDAADATAWLLSATVRAR